MTTRTSLPDSLAPPRPESSQSHRNDQSSPSSSPTHPASLSSSLDRPPAGPSPFPPNTTPADPVCKTVVRPGKGPVVPLHATCLVRYAGRVLSTGEIFVDSTDPTSRDQTDGDLVQIVAGRDAVRKNRGLYQLVGTMRKGEVCEAFVHSSAGYGDEGSFSFPSVPPKADLSYVVELVDFEPPQNGARDWFMTYEERLEAAKRRRVQGNEAFSRAATRQDDDGMDENGTNDQNDRTDQTDQTGQTGQSDRGGPLPSALAAYKSALAFLDDDFMMQLYDFHYDKAMEEKKTVMLNMAACYLKLDRHREAADMASMVLAVDAKNAKALYRRGVARRRLGQTAGALEDLERAMKLQEGAPDAGVLREIALVKGERRREDKAAGELYKNMMAKVVAIDDDREDDGDDRRDGHDRRRDGGREPTASAKTSETSEAATRGPTGVSAAVVAFILQLWTVLAGLFRGPSRR